MKAVPGTYLKKSCPTPETVSAPKKTLASTTHTLGIPRPDRKAGRWQRATGQGKHHDEKQCSRWKAVIDPERLRSESAAAARWRHRRRRLEATSRLRRRRGRTGTPRRDRVRRCRAARWNGRQKLLAMGAALTLRLGRPSRRQEAQPIARRRGAAGQTCHDDQPGAQVRRLVQQEACARRGARMDQILDRWLRPRVARGSRRNEPRRQLRRPETPTVLRPDPPT